MDNRILIIMVLIFMEQIFAKLKFITEGEGFIDITDDLNLFIKDNDFRENFYPDTKKFFKFLKIKKAKLLPETFFSKSLL